MSSKLLYALLLVFFCLSDLNAQNKDCENMVFNTIELMPFEFNERCKTESYPSLSTDGLNLYYTNNQTYDWIFYSHRDNVNSKWSVPVPIEINNFKSPIRSAVLSEDQSKLYFISGKKMYVANRGDKMFQFETPDEIDLKTDSDAPLAYISMYPGENKFIAYVNSKDPNGTMVQFRRTGENSFIFDKIISATKREMGTLSHNGLLYYFTNDDFPNVLFCRKRQDINSDFAPEIYKVRQFERHLTINQMRMSEQSGTLVLVLSDAVWDRNDIYFTEMKLNDSAARKYEVFDVVGYRQSLPVKNTEALVREYKPADPLKSRQIINTKGAEFCKIELGQAFPNPAKNTFYFYYSVSAENASENEMPVFKVIDVAGRVVYTEKLDQMKGEAKVILDDVPSGSYMIKVEYAGVSSDMIKITITL